LAWLNGRLRAQVRYPVITIVHHLRSSEIHPRPLLPFYRWVERCYLQSVDGLVYNSATTRATVLALAATHKPSIIAYPAADHRRPPDTAETLVRVAAQANSLEPLQILFVGNVIARKGLHQLLAALALLPRAQWRLAVVGSLTTDPGYVAQIRRMLVALDLLPNVVLHGACSDDALRGFYAQSALFAAPAYEGFGIAYLEAMSFGLPVIAATAGAAHEIVTHGIDGYLVAADDRAGLAASIARFCQDRLLLATMGQAARQRYDRHPTWQASFTPVVQWLQAQVV
jgi:glycosyltransferase involved in cell wall biosynthesis